LHLCAQDVGQIPSLFGFGTLQRLDITRSALCNHARSTRKEGAMSASDWNVKVDPIFGCWVYQGRLDNEGYPVTWGTSGPIKVHRKVFEAEIGPIPMGHVLDHECAVRACCSPAHLSPVLQGENLKRRSWKAKARRVRCKEGHDMRENGVVTPKGGYVCRTCSRQWMGTP
jgi:hypothetical protein